MEEYKLLNGALMRKYPTAMGKMFINVQETLSGGTQLLGTTSDNQSITVQLNEPLPQPLQGWIEVVGKPKSATVFQCREIICFEQDENQQPFDAEAHNELCSIFDIVREGDLYKNKIE